MFRVSVTIYLLNYLDPDSTENVIKLKCKSGKFINSTFHNIITELGRYFVKVLQKEIIVEFESLIISKVFYRK